ncbi:PucR family transcriptional regulator [Paenibacillus sanguinis]|uniref:PucR family transcriptional regulator n=1 Tax=Paenibacillus sanguinis TaxID=225906 RepID=UPI000369749E|nr:helix-turn-helix domain-containing protein [Paenibacillus sanguinis]
MDIKLLKQQVENIVDTSLTESNWELEAWNGLIRQSGGNEFGPFRQGQRWIWLLKYQSSSVLAFEAEAKAITEAEAKLIQMVLSSMHPPVSPIGLKRDEEARSLQLGQWLQERLEQGELEQSIPDNMPIKTKLRGRLLPFLLSWEHQGQAISFNQLNKLLKSYFGGAIVLVPLKEDWLILLGEELLTSLREDSEEVAETEREMLSALCEGLYELITNEWVGGLHLSVGDTLIAEAELTAATLALRQTLALGRMFNVTNQIHLPWELKLERLISSIPEIERERYIAERRDRSTLLQEEETFTTLETFFSLDCNVSETAKRLYIHRNTLLYRLDKFKQETGLDVRTFADAVLVKLELLLYKVTKRA